MNFSPAKVKTHMIKKKHIIIISLIVLFTGLLLTFSYNIETEIKKADGVILKAEDFSNGYNDLSVRILKRNEPKINTYTTTVSGDVLEPIVGENIHLIIFRLNAQAVRVYFNDVYIGTHGDMDKAQSHIYNSLGNFSIPKDILLDTNTIKLEINSLYMRGLEKDPIGIVDNETSRHITEKIEFRTQGLTFIGIGVFLLGIIITMMMIFLGEKKNIGLVYFLISIVFLSIYSMDFMKFTQLSIPYMPFKKIIVFSLFACVFFLGLFFSKMFDSKISWMFSAFLFCMIFLAAIFTGDLIAFKSIYNILIPLIAVNFILWIIIAAKNLNKKDEAIIFLCSFINLLILSVTDSLQMVILGGTISTSIVSYVLIFLFILILMLYLEISRRNVTIATETLQRSHFYMQAITDPLTGAFNLKHTVSLLSSEISPYTVAMIDIDDFKFINDKFGHQGGDFMLKHLVKKMQDEFRDNDLIGRYGGDEFIVVLRACSEKNAFNIMNRFRLHIENDRLHYGSNTMNTTLSIGIFYCDGSEKDSTMIIKSADEALYRAKHNGKNQVSI